MRPVAAARTGPSARSSTSSASSSPATRICGASRCPTIGKATRCAKITRCAGPRRERTPRPAFALKSNVVAGTPAVRHDARAALQRTNRSGAQPRSDEPRDDSLAAVRSRSSSAAATAMVLSMGPQHPSTHGVLQVITEIEGETSCKAEPEIGYLHTGIEKSAENLFWTQASTVIERMDYLAPLSNALCYVLAVEKLLGDHGSHPGARAAIRVMLVRAHAHRVALRVARHAAASTSARSRVLLLPSICAKTSSTCTKLSGGARMHPNYIRIGGLRDDIPRDSSTKLDALIEKYTRRMRELRALLQKNPILQDRMIDVGDPRRRGRDRRGASPGRRCARAASRTTCASAFPYLRLRAVRFRRPDAHRRRRVRALPRAARRDGPVDAHHRAGPQTTRPPGPVMIDDTKIAPPPERDDRALDGSVDPPLQDRQRVFRVPPGDVYQPIEGPRGELGYYIVSQRRKPAVAGAHAAAVACTICRCSRGSPSASSSPTWS